VMTKKVASFFFRKNRGDRPGDRTFFSEQGPAWTKFRFGPVQ